MKKNKMFASIIIPVCNDAESISKVLTVLTKINTSYPFEVIVVDNGSTDDTIDRVKKFEEVSLIKEHRFLNSPYSARNRGIEVAKGSVIILLDATCIPSEGWLDNGIRLLLNGSDIVGGDVVFDIDQNSTAGEWYDSLININMKESIEMRNYAMTANLFIKKELFEKIGFFPEGIRSGGDLRWTKNATINGFKLSFSKDATVKKKARNFKNLLYKQWRVSKAKPQVLLEMKTQKEVIKEAVRRFVKILLPPNPKKLSELIELRGQRYMRRYFVNLYLVFYCNNIVSKTAFIYGYFKK